MVYDTNPIRTKTPIRAFFIRISRQFALLIARKVLPQIVEHAAKASQGLAADVGTAPEDALTSDI